jgi:peptide/nickel transport system permease protein
MLVFVVRRLLISIPLMIGLVAIVFVVLRTAVPGDVAALLAGDQATPEMVEAIRRDMGLDRPIPVQFGIFLANLAQGDLGRSAITRQPVTARILQAMPITLTLATLTALIATLLGLLLGVITAYYANSWLDNLLRVLVVFGASMPSFWIGPMLILIFAVWLRTLPVQGSMTTAGLVLPIATLGIGAMAGLSRITRAGMLEVLNSDYIRTARAKGLHERTVVLGHAFRNALIPAITLIGVQFGGLLGGSVITEKIFGLPGMGTLAINAIHNRDYPVVQGVVLVIAAIYLLVNLLVDIAYAFVNPRIRYD